jgi:hypothetical protein
MRIAPFTLGALAAVTLVLGSARSAEAQTRASLPTSKSTLFDITPYAGYMVFGDYFSGPLGTAITNAPSTVVGAQLGMRIAPNVSIIGNLATTNSDVQAGVPFFGGVSIAKSTLTMYDAGLQFDLPMGGVSGTQFSPFVQASAGAMRYDLSESLLTTTATNLAANLGVGADISVGSGVGVRLMARDYIGNFNFQDATSLNVTGNTTQSFMFSAGLRFSF